MESKLSAGKNIGGTEKERKRLVLAQHQMPAKHLEYIHLRPIVVVLVVNTVAGWSSCGQALALNTLLHNGLTKLMFSKLERFTMSVAQVVHNGKKLATVAVPVSRNRSDIS